MYIVYIVYPRLRHTIEGSIVIFINFYHKTSIIWYHLYTILNDINILITFEKYNTYFGFWFKNKKNSWIICVLDLSRGNAMLLLLQIRECQGLLAKLATCNRGRRMLSDSLVLHNLVIFSFFYHLRWMGWVKRIYSLVEEWRIYQHQVHRLTLNKYRNCIL